MLRVELPLGAVTQPKFNEAPADFVRLFALKLLMGGRAELVLDDTVDTVVECVAGHDLRTIMERLHARQNFVKFDLAAHERLVNGFTFRARKLPFDAIVCVSPTNSLPPPRHFFGADAGSGLGAG